MLTWKDILTQIAGRHDLSAQQSAWAMNDMMTGTVNDVTLAAFIMGLKVKGETAVEVRGLVEAMLANAVRVPCDVNAVDIVGTGGDGAHTVNISTMSSLVVAGAGVPVLKHGNRAISSKSGTADVLEALGVAISIPAEHVATCLAEAGIAFCFAPTHHPSMRYAATVRKELGIPTVFNVLGPLANPGQPPAALLGCADLRFARILAEVQLSRGIKTLVVRSELGIDELTSCAPNRLWDVTADGIEEVVFTPEEVGLVTGALDDLRGGDATENANVVRSVLSGNQHGAMLTIRQTVALNSASALVAHDALLGGTRFGPTSESVVERIKRAVPVALAALDNGSALNVLDLWASVSQKLAH